MRFHIVFFLVIFLFSTASGEVKGSEREILSKTWKEYNRGELDTAEEGFRRITKSDDQATSFEATMGLGYTLIRKKRYIEARKLFYYLVEKGYNREKTIPAVIDICVEIKDFETLKKLFEKIPEKDKPRVKKLILYHEITVAKEGSAKRLKAAMEMLKIDEKDSFALNIAAWHNYNIEKYEDSLGYFKILYEKDRADQKIILGLGYCLIKLNRYDEALLLVDRRTISGIKDIDNLRINLFKRIVDKAEKEGNGEVKEKFLKKILGFDPFENYAVTKYAELLCERGEREKALIFINKTYDWRKDPSSAFSLLIVLDNTGFKSQAYETAESFSQSNNETIKKAASSYFFSKSYPITASMVYESNDKLYSNAYSSRIDGSYYHRHRTGDNGTSRVEEEVMPLGFTMTKGLGRQWFFAVKSGHIDSGSAVTQAGSYYRYLNNDENLEKFGNRVSYTGVFFGMENEGRNRYSFLIGSSPLLSDVSATPVFNLIYNYNSWQIDLHRESIDDSILSFCGLDDPYSDDSWGRVLKNGAMIGNTFDISDYWFTARTEFNWYEGENVWGNASRQIDLAFGRTFSEFEDTEITLGLFFTYLSFDRNSNFFTYGHGGYYSPESLIVAGPLVRFKTKPYKKYWFDLQLSTGWMDEKTEDSPFYPISNETSSLTPSASSDYNGIYGGSNSSGVAFSMKLEAWRLLSSKNLSLGSFFHLNQSPGYNEWKAGFAIEYSFEPWNSFWKRENIDNRFTIR